MKMISITKQLLFIASISAASIFTSCDPKPVENPPMQVPYSGVYIVNEGPYGSGTGTISFYNRNTKEVVNDLFGKYNNALPLGNIVQSMNIIDGKTYIVVNNANKIEVVNAVDFKSVKTISGLTQPRYIIQTASNKAYLSQWGSGSTGEVKVIDLSTNAVTKTISTGNGPEKMLLKGNYVYVTCSGGNVSDSVVSIINTASETVEKSLVVGPNPKSIVEDINGNIWVLCAGKYKSDYSGLEKSGKLVKIDPASNTVLQTLDFTSTSSMPSDLTINMAKNKLFFNYDGKVYSQNINSTSLDNVSIVNKSFYGLGIDPTTDIIYGADAGNYSSAGKVIRYNISGSVIDTLKVGVAPNGFFFR